MSQREPGLLDRLRRNGTALSLIVALLVGSCLSPVGVKQTGFGPVFAELNSNALLAGVPSARSRETLAALGLAELNDTDPDAALARIEEIALREHGRPLFAVLAEMHYARAIATQAPSSFLAAAIHAYFYLFSDELRPATDPYDPQFRLACDIYNRGLARALMEDSGDVNLHSRTLDTPVGALEIEASRAGFPWSEAAFGRFLPADAFQVRGLRERVRTSGLGVPLIAVRTGGETDAIAKEHIGPKLKLAATAVLEIDGGLAALEAHRLHGKLDLYLASDVHEVELGGHHVPLETDLTAPLAYTLEKSKIWDFSLKGFMEGSAEYPTGVFQLQPYQRGKIPVVLVHGTASNPAVWAQLVNGLKSDSELRSKYQVWIAMYNTGTPVLFNAAKIRASLQDLLAQLDPRGEDPALRRMVIIGHSQGGLVTRLLVTSSGDRFWRNLFDRPFEDYGLSEEASAILRPCFFFEPLPFVERAVFVATPHRGSFFAGGFISWMSSLLVSLPQKLTAAGDDLLKNADLPPEVSKEIPTSVENMRPESPFLRVLNSLPFAPSVHLHSIVAVQGTGPVAEGDDGFVGYTSAHLDQAESEFVVRCGHSCQNEPETVLEVRRILLLQLKR